MLITLKKSEVMLEYHSRHAQKTKLVEAYKIALGDSSSSNHHSVTLTQEDENDEYYSNIREGIFEEAKGR